MFITANDSNATLAAGITAVATSLTTVTGQGARFPAVVAPDRIACVLSDGSTFEYVDITGHVANSETFNIARATDSYQNSTPTALAHTTSAKLTAVITKRMLENVEPIFIATQAGLPVASPRDGMQLFARNYGGRRVLKTLSPRGIDNFIQQALYDSQHILWSPGAANGFSFIGDTPTVTGTITTVAPVAGSFGAEMSTRNIASAATLNTCVGLLGSTLQFSRIVASGHGGFWMLFRFRIGTVTAASFRFFMGVTSLTALPITNPSVMAASYVGVGMDAADTTLQIMRKDGTTAQKISIVGSTEVVGRTYDVGIYCPPGDGTNAGSIYYRVDDVDAGTTLQEDNSVGVTTNAPLANKMMRPMVAIGTSAAASQSVKLQRAYFFSDY